MTIEQKQALIEGCTQRVDALKNYCRFKPDDREASLDLCLCQIALAALTAPPVKQPSTECIGWVKEAIQEHDAKWRDAIREAGYEVEG